VIINRNELLNQNQQFLEYLYSLGHHFLRGLAVKECNVNSTNKCVHAWVNAIYTKYTNHLNQNNLLLINISTKIEELQRNQLENPNFIPFPIDVVEEDFELLSVSSYEVNDDDDEEDELEITWYIDRTSSNSNKEINKNISISINIQEQAQAQEQKQEQKQECNICYEEKIVEHFITIQCNHEFCHDCIIKQIDNNKPCCALCRETMKHFTIKSNLSNELIKNNLYNFKQKN
jgi:hypothetical protein